MPEVHTSSHRAEEASTSRAEPLLALSLFAAAAVAGSRLLPFTFFADEGHCLSVGRLMGDGQVLYRDLLSHHFPFACYWSGGVAALLGPSVLAARISVLAFQLGTFLWLARFTRQPLAVGAAALAWNLVSPYYCGQMLLDQTFTTCAVTALFGMTFALLAEIKRPDFEAAVFFGSFAGVALLGNPLTIHVLGLCGLVLATSPSRWAFLTKAALVAAILPAAFVLHLAIVGGIDEFKEQVLDFSFTLSRERGTGHPLRLPAILEKAAGGLGILNPHLRRGVWPASMHWGSWTIDDSLVTGFAYRASWMAAAAVLAGARRFRLATFVYLFAATWLGQRWLTAGVRTAPFAMTSILLMCWLVLGSSLRAGFAGPHSRWAPPLLRLGRLPVALGLAGLVLFGLQSHRKAWRNLQYESSFGELLGRAQLVEEVAPGRRDVLVGDYPAGTYMSFFTGRRPPAGILALYPWVAERGLGRLIADLARHPAVLHVDWESDVRGVPTREYLAPLRQFLEQHYADLGDGWYAERGLARSSGAAVRAPGPTFSDRVPTAELDRSLQLEQTFLCLHPGLSRIEIALATHARANEGTVTVELLDDAAEMVAAASVPAATVLDNRWWSLSFRPRSDSAGRRYRLRLTSTSPPGRSITVLQTPTDTYADGSAAANQQPLPGDLVFRYRYLFPADEPGKAPVETTGR